MWLNSGRSRLRNNTFPDWSVGFVFDNKNSCLFKCRESLLSCAVFWLKQLIGIKKITIKRNFLIDNQSFNFRIIIFLATKFMPETTFILNFSTTNVQNFFFIRHFYFWIPGSEFLFFKKQNSSNHLIYKDKKYIP